jgi:hypothetical protein
MKLTNSLKFGTISLVVLLLFSCTPSKRLANLQKNHPYLFDTTDSVEVRIIPTSYSDTSYVSNRSDTFYFEKERVKTFVYNNHDTITIFQEVEPCTTYVQTKTIQSLVPAETEWNLWGFDRRDLILLGVILLIVLLLILRR